MPASSIAFRTPPDAPRWKRLLVYSPVARLTLFAALLVVFTYPLGLVLHLVGLRGTDTSELQRAIGELIVRSLPAVLAYLVLVRGVERRWPGELLPRSALAQGGLGLLGGFALFSAVVGMLWLLGSYHVSGIHASAHWLPQLLAVGLGAGIGEEIISRGVLFRIVEEGLGTWVSLVVSALFFGAAHLGNPAATVWSAAAIAIEAGLLFGLLYHVTRSLPLCMGAHAAWNFAQGAIYGIPVSGTHADGLLVSQRTGPTWLSGGLFGAEASVGALALCLLCSLALLTRVLRVGSAVPPLLASRHMRAASRT